jgi:hypothetical protein
VNGVDQWIVQDAALRNIRKTVSPTAANNAPNANNVGLLYCRKKFVGEIPGDQRSDPQNVPRRNGFRGIGRVLNVSNTAVLGWIKKFGQAAELTVPATPVQTAELDELHTFVGKKRLPMGLAWR